MEGVTGIGFAAEVPIRYPSRDADGERYADSESEAESHASSDAKVHSDALCAIFDFFELCGVRDRVAIVDVESKWQSPKVGPDRDYSLDATNKRALNDEIRVQSILANGEFSKNFAHF